MAADRKHDAKGSSSILARALAAARQCMVPEEFRIPPSPWREHLGAMVAALAVETPQPGSAERGLDPARSVSPRLLAEFCTGLWRIRERVMDPQTKQPREGMGRAFRHVEDTWDILAEHEIRILDHTGEQLPASGQYGVQPLAYEPTPGLLRDTVIETIKPTIMQGDQRIQMGEVIVGTPQADTPPGDDSSALP